MVIESAATTAASQWAAHAGGMVHFTDQPGVDPAVVLLHGFPDDLHSYDRLVPKLSPYRAVAVDWLGYGRSARPAQRRFARTDRQRDLSAVIDTLALERIVLVGHDASGPEAVDWALAHPERTGRVVLLNSYYGHAAALHFPELVRLLADPELRALADAVMDDPQLRRWLLGYTARRFGLDPDDQDGIGARSVLAQFFGGPAGPDALSEIRAWAGDLLGALDAQDWRVKTGALARLPVPVSLVFGAQDAYLNPEVGRHLAELLRTADLHLLDAAGHWPQWDEPDAVARLITAGIENAHVPPARREG